MMTVMPSSFFAVMILTLQYLVSLFTADERWRFNITVFCHLYLQLMSAGDLTLQYFVISIYS